MTRIKHGLCVLLTGAMLLQPMFLVSHATEDVLSSETEVTIPIETEVTETLPDEQTAEPTPTEATEAEPTEPMEATGPVEATEPTEVTEPEPTEASVTEAEEDAPEEAAHEESIEPEAVCVRPYENFPNYSMEDYGDIMYGAGTIKSNGSSITCLAALATCLTGHPYYPNELAGYFGGYGNNNIERLLYGSSTLKLPFYQAANYHDVLSALSNGKMAIQLMNSRSIFTDFQHFIVIKGYNSNGLLEVYDPSAANREHWLLKNGFENGFTEDELCWGYAGAWIYDPAQIPDNPFIYEPPAREYVEPRYDGLQLTEDEIDVLAHLVWVEARGESAEGQQAIAEVVLNRLASGRFQKSLRGIILDEEQFVPHKLLNEAKPEQAQYDAINRALYGPYLLPMEVYFYGTTPITDNIWGSIGRHIFCYADE